MIPGICVPEYHTPDETSKSETPVVRWPSAAASSCVEIGFVSDRGSVGGRGCQRGVAKVCR